MRVPGHYDTEARSTDDNPVTVDGDGIDDATATSAEPKSAATSTQSSQSSGSSSDSDEPTKDELYEEAQDLDVEGRSTMSKGELRKAVKRATKKKKS